MFQEIISVIIGYLLGSIPSAYIITRLTTGKDIRRLGGGNVGGLNTLREVGFIASVPVVIIDLGKGAAAVAIAHWLLKVEMSFVLLTGLASIVGHNWMLFLKFSGGKGVSVTFGALAVLLPLNRYWQGFLILIRIVLIPFIITRNIALSMGIGLVALPFIFWLGMHSGPFIAWSMAVGIIIALKFFPTARTAWTRSKNKKDFTSMTDGKARN